ncbi:MAG: hypothetical protein ISS88_03295 [Candidatus Portnoybacteria bacterium]|nr:hypothetical protein [Candidatus Portnoybacteria bacterium]
MNLSVLLAGLVLATLLAGACLAAILVYFDPTVSGSLIFILFYLSLLITATGIFTLIGLFIRRISQKRRFPLLPSRAIRQLEISFRQGLLLAVILVAALILQSQRILAWWHLIILVGLVGLAEWWLARR